MSTDSACPDEDSFQTAWREACLDGNGQVLADPGELALAGGALADRLAWVFVSGYQAAVRQCFEALVAGSGWTCLAAAEGREGPGCTLTADGAGFLLNGEKSWIAGAASLESLVVSVGEGEQGCFAGVAADAPGVSIDLPRTPGFLGEMSQGVARFTGTPVVRVLREPVRARAFRGAEPLYVMLALNACLRSRAMSAGQDALVTLTEQAIAQGRTLTAVLEDKQAIVPGLQALRSLTSQVLKASAPVIARHPALAASWRAMGICSPCSVSMKDEHNANQ